MHVRSHHCCLSWGLLTEFTVVMSVVDSPKLFILMFTIDTDLITWYYLLFFFLVRKRFYKKAGIQEAEGKKLWHRIKMQHEYALVK